MSGGRLQHSDVSSLLGQKNFVQNKQPYLLGVSALKWEFTTFHDPVTTRKQNRARALGQGLVSGTEQEGALLCERHLAVAQGNGAGLTMVDSMNPIHLGSRREKERPRWKRTMLTPHQPLQCGFRQMNEIVSVENCAKGKVFTKVT